MAVQQSATGPDPYAVVFEAVSERTPGHVLEIGCGRGELAERMSRELKASVVAVDQSERMVELTAARGVEAIVADAQDLPFHDGIFDCAVAAWMLYHVQDLEQALRELRRVLRPDGRLVAATSSERNLGELWRLVGERGAPSGGFSAESAEGTLSRHFTSVERRDVRGTSRFPTARPPTVTSRLARPAASSPTACPSSTAHSSRRDTSPSLCASRDQAGGAD